MGARGADDAADDEAFGTQLFRLLEDDTQVRQLLSFVKHLKSKDLRGKEKLAAAVRLCGKLERLEATQGSTVAALPATYYPFLLLRTAV